MVIITSSPDRARAGLDPWVERHLMCYVDGQMLCDQQLRFRGRGKDDAGEPAVGENQVGYP